MSLRSAPWLLLCAGVLVGAAGCANEPDEAVQQDIRPADDVAQDMKDTWITTKIQAQYFADDDVKGRNIDVTTNDGVVTLSGVVEDERSRQQAVAIARNTEDVVRVDDRLSAEPAAAPGVARETDSGPRAEDDDTEIDERLSNAWITTKIQSKYFADAMVKGRNIDVTTNNGVVTLEGRVGSDTEREHAVQLARGTDGVRRVEDRLMLVEPEATVGAMPAGEAAPAPPPAGATDTAAGNGSAEPSDARPVDSATDMRMTDAGITTRVQSKFYLDDQIKARLVTVRTENGVVTLGGDVPSESQRQRALSLARSVHGVREVKDELTVAGSVEGTAQGAAAPGTRDDSWVTTKIQSKFYTDPLIKAGDVQVAASGGTVTLTGTVTSEEAKRRAETLARETAGVRQVTNNVTVRAEASGPS